MTLFLTHKACLDHLTPPGHPERPDRLRAVEAVLAQDRFDALVRDTAPPTPRITASQVPGDIEVSPSM